MRTSILENNHYMLWYLMSYKHSILNAPNNTYEFSIPSILCIYKTKNNKRQRFIATSSSFWNAFTISMFKFFPPVATILRKQSSRIYFCVIG